MLSVMSLRKVIRQEKIYVPHKSRMYRYIRMQDVVVKGIIPLELYKLLIL